MTRWCSFLGLAATESGNSRVFVQFAVHDGTMTAPTVRGRRLARTLRRLREQAKLTLDQVAESMSWSTSKLSRIETAQQGVTAPDLKALLAVYVVEAEQAEAILRLSRATRQRGWWNAYGDSISQSYTEYLSLEAEATSMCSFQNQVIPGLFQTEEYARSLIRTVEMDCPPEVVEARVRARMARQSLLRRAEPMRVWAVVDESALRRGVDDPPVMIDQLERLEQMADLPEIVLQILPFKAGMHPAIYGPFVTLEFGPHSGPGVAYVETLAGDLYIEGEAELHRYAEVFNHLRATALSPEQSVLTIGRIAREWQKI